MINAHNGLKFTLAAPIYDTDKRAKTAIFALFAYASKSIFVSKIIDT
jgi:hypothetical protein